MGRIAFLFPGQGAQHPGMGAGLDEFESAAEVFAAVEKARPGVCELIKSGGAEELALTINTQPCMFAVELAAAKALGELGIEADGCAGFSLGEITALCYSRAISADDGAKLVCTRAELMQRAAEQNPGGMVAVLKLEQETVEKLCADCGAFPVNYNCPGQISVAGSLEALEKLKALVAEAGGRAVPLAVSGGFHSPFMHGAAEGLRKALENYDIVQPSIPLYSNRTALPYSGDLKALVAEQVENPVRFRQTVERMLADGLDTFVEVGPGKVLSGFVQRTAPGAKVLRCETAEEACAVADALK